MRILFLLALAFLVPGAAAVTVGVDNPYGPTPTTLYFHIMDAQNDVPINTQVPDERYTAVARAGLATNSLCFDEAADLPDPLNQPLADKEYHTILGYSTPSYVEYAFLTDGKPRLHPERAMGYDIELDDQRGPVLHWYLQTGTGFQSGNVPADPEDAMIPVPNVVVEATMREGWEQWNIDRDYRDAPVLMHGRSNPAILAGSSTSGATYSQVDGRHVYEITVPLEFLATTIPGDIGYSVEVNVYLDNPYCAAGSEGDYLMPNSVDHYLDLEHLPRLELSILNPLRIQYLAPQFVGDDLIVHSSVQSAWGNYDIDEPGPYNGNRSGGFGLELISPGGERVDPHDLTLHVIQRYYEYAHQWEPVKLTHVWNYTEHRAEKGLYQAHFFALNDQRTANATATAAFEIGKSDVYIAQENDEPYAVQEESLEMPGIGLLALVVLLALAVVLRRR